MTHYTLKKGAHSISVRIDENGAEARSSTGENQNTSTKHMTPTEAGRWVNDLIRQGYKAQKKTHP